MRNNWVLGFVFSAFLLCLYSCKNDSMNAGESILSDEDKITVKSDTFAVASALDSCMSISVAPDSFLLGECETNFGVIQADILAQLACPEGFKYPETLATIGENGDTVYVNLNPTVDSICLYLYYNTWYGDGNAPIGLNVYEMDIQTLEDNKRYYSDLELTDYCSLDPSSRITSYSSIIVPALPTDSAYSTATESYVSTVRVKLSDEFAQRFFAIKDFSSQKAFNEQFKGIYICSDFGGSNVLYVKDLAMTVFYHFTMSRPGTSDSIIHDTKSFYVNEEVRHVNRFVYPQRQDVLAQYSLIQDTNYIVSPANISTKLSIRMDSIFDRIEEQLGGDAALYSVYVNKARLTVDVFYTDSLNDRPRDSWESPASYMMLVKEDQVEKFFENNQMLADTCAIVASLSTQIDSLDQVQYYYQYDLSSILTNQLRKEVRDRDLTFVLLPVAVLSNASSGAVTSVSPLQTISTTRIRSASNAINPMDIEMVYCGFNRTH